MQYGVVIVIFLIIAAIGLILQGAALMGMFFAAVKLRKQAVQAAQEAKQKADQAVRIAMEILSDAREPVKVASVNFAEVSKLVRNRAVQLDATVQDITERTQSQVTRADQVLSEVFDKVEVTANAVERNVVSPLLEISAIFKGVQVGLGQFFRGRNANLREVAQDEEMFI